MSEGKKEKKKRIYHKITIGPLPFNSNIDFELKKSNFFGFFVGGCSAASGGAAGGGPARIWSTAAIFHGFRRGHKGSRTWSIHGVTTIAYSLYFFFLVLINNLTLRIYGFFFFSFFNSFHMFCKNRKLITTCWWNIGRNLQGRFKKPWISCEGSNLSSVLSATAQFGSSIPVTFLLKIWNFFEKGMNLNQSLMWVLVLSPKFLVFELNGTLITSQTVPIFFYLKLKFFTYDLCLFF